MFFLLGGDVKPLAFVRDLCDRVKNRKGSRSENESFSAFR